MTSVAYSADGKHIASGSEDKTVNVWDAEGGKERMTLNGHPDSVAAVRFSPDGKYLVSGSMCVLKVWETGKKAP